MLEQSFVSTSSLNTYLSLTRARRAPSFVLCFAVAAFIACAVQTEAQQPDANVRERRAPAVQPSATKGASQEEKAAEVADDKAVESAAVGDGVAEGEETGARITIEDLRAQFKAAKTGAERARLQRELISHLVGSDHKAAVDELRAMLGDERFDPAGYYNIGNALARLGESRAAADAYRKAIGQRRGNYARAQNNLGVVLMRLGRWDEAQEALSAALRLESNNYPEANYNLGRLYALRGEAGLAINAWSRTLIEQPDHTDAAIALARALVEDGDPARGLAVLDAFDKRMARRGTDTPRAIALARGEIVATSNVVADTKGGDRRLASSGKNTGGETRRTSARSAASTLRPLTVDQQTYDLLQRARTAREAGRNVEAVNFYRRVISNRGGYFPPANLELGYALAGLQRDEEAVASLLPVTTKDGGRYPIAFYHLGRLYERLDQMPRAVEAFSRAVSLYGQDNPQFFIDLSRVQEKEGNMQAALDAMESYIRASERTGDAPRWAQEKLAKLRQARASNPAPSKP